MSSEMIKTGIRMMESAELDQARGYFEGLTASTDGPDRAAAHLWLARLDLMAREYDAAWDHVSQAHQQAEPAVRAETLAVEGLYHVLRENWAKAISALEESQAADPALAMNYANLCTAYRSAERRDEAVEMGRKAIEISPKDASAHFAYAQALAVTGDFEKATIEVGAALRLNPLHVAAYLLSATLFEAAGDLDTLAETLEIGIRVNPKAWPLREKLLEVQLKRANYHGALEQAAAIANATERTADSLAAAECARLANNKPVAEWYFQFAISRDPQAWQPHYGLALLYLSDGFADSAIRELRSAIACDPRAWEPHDQLGLVLQSQGLNGEAEAALKTAISAGPSRPEPVLHLIQFLRAMNRQDEAARYAGQLSPDAAARLAKGEK